MQQLVLSPVTKSTRETASLQVEKSGQQILLRCGEQCFGMSLGTAESLALSLISLMQQEPA